MQFSMLLQEYLSPTFKTVLIDPLYIIFIPWQAVFTTMLATLNAPDEDQKNALALTWMQQKLNELTFVGITGAIFAAATTTAFSWPEITSASTVTKSAWYGSLLLNAIAVSISSQQAITLHRLACYPDTAKRIRSMLGRPAPFPTTKAIRPIYSQVYLWQSAVILLNFGILLFIVGFCFFIYTAVCLDKILGCTAKEKLAGIVIGGIAGFGGLTYLTSMAILYSETSKHAAKDKI